MKFKVSLAVLTGAAIAATTVWLARLSRQKHTLTHELARLAAQREIQPPRPPSISLKSAMEEPLPDSEAGDTEAGQKRLEEAMQRFPVELTPEQVTTSVGGERLSVVHFVSVQGPFGYTGSPQANAWLEALSPADLASMISTDPQLTFLHKTDEADVSDDVVTRRWILNRALVLAFKAAPVTALRLIENASLADRESLWTYGTIVRQIDDALTAWLRTDAPAAVSWAVRRAPDLPEDRRHVARVLQAAARSDLTAAWSLAVEQEIPPETCLHALLTAARSRKDLDLIMSALAHDRESRGELVTADSSTIGLDLPADAPHYLSACVNGTQRLLGTHGFEAARAFFDRWADTPEVRRAVPYAMVEGIVYETGPRARAAADWWIAQAPENLRESQTRELMHAWCTEDFAEAAAWLQTLPAGHLRDAGLESLSHWLAPYDMPAVVSWATLFHDDQRRDNALREAQATAIQLNATRD